MGPELDRRIDHDLRRSIDEYRCEVERLKEQAEVANGGAMRTECLKLARALTDLADALQGRASD
jgi:hypothetical protein